ncbi:hypothetical protein AKJ64_03545 [candidate division MSBL1 archaeon SCGC-AAA259E17]|uniref:Uncharacterized protein n=1 Tax=candidate division MSBL1 archaeon SCGC-AAA259E17 TaxID=1698263 RepID=A0A133UDN8_9EURY|nr:hypothetical protein AKJ64_03545 [candidate division MSBL1 archaeon SCGC-AAA259E17]
MLQMNVGREGPNVSQYHGQSLRLCIFVSSTSTTSTSPLDRVAVGLKNRRWGVFFFFSLKGVFQTCRKLFCLPVLGLALTVVAKGSDGTGNWETGEARGEKRNSQRFPSEERGRRRQPGAGLSIPAAGRWALDANVERKMLSD